MIDPFLYMTATAYIIGALIYNKSFVKNFPRWLEKFFFLTMGAGIILQINLDLWGAWLILAVGYTGIALTCWLGEQDWGSEGRNLLMICWDLLIAVVCFSKII